MRKVTSILGCEISPRTAVWLVAIGPLVLWLGWGLGGVWWVSRFWHGATPGIQEMGQTGDLFGGINALFAAYAFAGVAVAAWFQRQTYQVAEAQLRQQAFEPLFFHLLELTRAISPQRLVHPGIRGEPSVELSEFASYLQERIFPLLPRMIKQDQPQNSDLCDQQFAPLYLANEDALGPYFRSLYHVFKLIQRSNLPMADKLRYGSIARSTLSRSQLFLLMVDCCTPRGRDFRPLTEEFGLLKHIPRDPNQPTGEELLAELMFSPTAVMDAAGRAAYRREHRVADQQLA